MGSWQLAGLILGSTPQERIGPGLQVTVIGMSVVFAVLILLYFILTLVGRFGTDQASAPSAGSGRPASPVPVQSSQLVQTADVAGAARPEVTDQASAATDDRSTEQLAAVIVAAIAAATPDGQPASHQTQRRQNAQLGWAMAGRIALHTAREFLPRG